MVCATQNQVFQTTPRSDCVLCHYRVSVTYFAASFLPSLYNVYHISAKLELRCVPCCRLSVRCGQLQQWAKTSPANRYDLNASGELFHRKSTGQSQRMKSERNQHLTWFTECKSLEQNRGPCLSELETKATSHGLTHGLLVCSNSFVL